MKRAGFRLMLVLLLGMALLQSVGSVVAVNDTTPPVVQSASLSATTVAAGGSLTVTLHITDDLSGLAAQYSASISFDLSGGTQSIYTSDFLRVSGTAQDGMYQAILTSPPLTRPAPTPYTISPQAIRPATPSATPAAASRRSRQPTMSPSPWAMLLPHSPASILPPFPLVVMRSASRYSARRYRSRARASHRRPRPYRRALTQRPPATRTGRVHLRSGYQERNCIELVDHSYALLRQGMR